jgi:hypothetical protein
MASKGFFNAFADVWMHEGVRTPMVDYCGALGHISPTDLGIKAAREALKRAGIAFAAPVLSCSARPVNRSKRACAKPQWWSAPRA